MKNIYYSLSLLFLISLGSCKEFLDTKPTDFLNPDDYYQTEEQLNSAMAGVYDVLGAPALYGNYAQFQYAWVGDEGYMNRNSSGPHSYNFTTSDPSILAYWSNLYEGINRANVLLANVDKNKSIRENFRNQIRGEVLFLRGYYYFQLVQYFGGVPIRLVPTESIVDVDIPRNTVKEVYEQIVKDMTEAEPLVPGIQYLGFGGRVNKSAVRGMLARVFLHMAGYPLKDESKYADAKLWAKKVMDDTEAAHQINPSYPDIFIKLAADQYDIKESIWEAEFSGNRLDQYVEQTSQGWINSVAVATNNKLTGRADAFMRITAKLYDIFEPGDNRKWWSIAHFGYTTLNPEVNGSKSLTGAQTTNQLNKFSMFPGKFRREYETRIPKYASGTPQNVPLLRYTDVLLMYAEADNEINGPTPEAIDIINSIRRRGWSTGVKPTVGLTGITVTNGGSGYTSVPKVTFSQGVGGITATATAVISGGKVTAINLNRDSTGTVYNKEGKYSLPPTVTITGGGGSGASAITTIFTLSDADLKATQASSKESFRALIQDERMRELSFEGLRKSDLHRWGIFFTVMQDLGSAFKQAQATNAFAAYMLGIEPKHEFWPIPNIETTNNHLIVQNPGWN